MEKIEGVDLNVLLYEETEQIKANRIARARKAVAGLLIEIDKHREAERKAKQEHERACDKLSKCAAKLEQLKAGNWGVLEESKEEKDHQK
jgi:hypothetical protein